MRLKLVKEIVAKELLEASRERRALIAMVLLPILSLVLALIALYPQFHAFLAGARIHRLSFWHPGFLAFTIPLSTVIFSYQLGLDITAGEKERSTLETTLCIPVEDFDLALGKYAAICVAALMGAFCFLILPVLTGAAALLMGFAAGETFYDLAFLKSLILLLGSVVAIAVPVSAGVLVIGSLARRMIEANAMLQLFVMGVMFSPMLIRGSSLSLDYLTAWIPILGGLLLLKGPCDSMNGLIYLPLVLLGSFAAAWVAIRFSASRLTSGLE